MILLDAVDEGLNVIVRKGNRMAGKVGGYAETVGHAQSRRSGAGFHEEAVGVSVITTVELDDVISPRETPREADGRHSGFCAGADQANLLNRGNGFHKHLRENCFAFRWRPERSAFLAGLLNRG